MAHMKGIHAALRVNKVETKQKVAMDPLLCWGPTCGQTTYMTPTILRCTGNVDRRKAAYITPAAYWGGGGGRSEDESKSGYIMHAD